MTLPEYPVREIRKQIEHALSSRPFSVLQAPPGSGKSTLVPLYLAELFYGSSKGSSFQGQIILLQPRRAAVRAVALRLRELASTAYSVGWMTREEQDVPADARILVMTEGIFIRRLLSDPEATGIDLLILDEFHERSWQVDLSLVLARQAQEIFAPQLKLLVMSATLEDSWFVHEDAEVISTEASLFSLSYRYEPAVPERDVSRSAARLALEAHAADPQAGILVFLPGEGEIRRCVSLLQEALSPGVPEILPLYGRQSAAEQQSALRPARGPRIIVATNVAETSLTIDGIRCVIDCGLRRHAVYEASRGMNRLVTSRISRASAVQRAGRAGRQGPGRVIRMWSETEQLQDFDVPEIRSGDLSSLLLALAAWGDVRWQEYRWIDPPDEARAAAAFDLLMALGALDERGVITDFGKAMQALPLDVRSAAMVLRASRGSRELLEDAVLMAAMLQEGDPLDPELSGRYGADIWGRLELLRESEARSPESGTRGLRRIAASRIRREAKRILRELKRHVNLQEAGSTEAVAVAGLATVLAEAYPDRVGRYITGRGLWLLSGGRECRLDDAAASVFEGGWLVAAEVQRGRKDSVIRLALAMSEAEAAAWCRQHEEISLRLQLDSGRLKARRVRSVGAIVLEERPVALAELNDASGELLRLISADGVGAFGWSERARRLQNRLLFLRGLMTGQDAVQLIPDVSDAALAVSAGDWLPAFLPTRVKPESLQNIDMYAVLMSLLPYDIQRRLDDLAPESLRLPSGSMQKLRYAAGSCVLAARIQQLFGMMESPRIARGLCAGLEQGTVVEIELLSPARRPMQITRDLAGFWERTYAEVRKELRGRYPKHYWPEDPSQAEATDRAKRRK
ncbi:ATP-dependent helicase HrpB [Spirochaeta dissipatitropha]